MLRSSVREREKNVHLARHLRKKMTLSERLLWSKLKGKKFLGLKFRRQAAIGPFIVDYLCVERKLIIEIDGDVHFQFGKPQRDARRDQYLRSKGFTVLHFQNVQIREATDDVIRSVGAVLGFHMD